MADAHYALGIVVNPKLRKPVLAVGYDNDVTIFSLEPVEFADHPLVRLGSGYYGSSDEPATEVTGLPRAHTPSGVKEKGMGYGTSLYTALCLGAYSAAEAMASIRTGGKGAGVSSMEGDRSGEAEHWWSAAKQSGLAREITNEREEIQEPDVDADDLARCVSIDGPGRIIGVRRLQVEVEISQQADAYPFPNARRRNLIVAVFTKEVLRAIDVRHISALWRRLRDTPDSEIELPGLDVFLGLDVRGLDEDALALLSVCAATAGASDEDLDGMRARWQYGMDPGTTIHQLRLPFKKNSAEDRTVREALARTQQARDQLGWEELAGLP